MALKGVTSCFIPTEITTDSKPQPTTHIKANNIPKPRFKTSPPAVSPIITVEPIAIPSPKNPNGFNLSLRNIYAKNAPIAGYIEEMAEL